MKIVIGIILIVGSLILGYLGIQQVQESGGSAEVMGIELSAEDEGAKEVGYIKIALGVVALVGGIYLVAKKDR